MFVVQKPAFAILADQGNKGEYGEADIAEKEFVLDGAVEKLGQVGVKECKQPAKHKAHQHAFFQIGLFGREGAECRAYKRDASHFRTKQNARFVRLLFQKNVGFVDHLPVTEQLGIILLFLGQGRELAFVILLQAAELGCAEVQVVELPLDLELFGNHVEARFLCQTGITDLTGNLAAAELFITGFYHIKLLFLCLYFRVFSPFFTQQPYITAFATPYFVHDGTELTAHILCNVLAQRLVGLGQFLFEKRETVLGYVVFGFDAVDLCIGLDEFIEQLLGIARKLIDLVPCHILRLGVIGSSYFLLLVAEHRGDKVAGLCILFGVAIDVGLTVDTAEGIGQKNCFIGKGARHRNLDQVGFANGLSLYPPTQFECITAQ